MDTGCKSLFTDYQEEHGPDVILGDDNACKTKVWCFEMEMQRLKRLPMYVKPIFHSRTKLIEIRHYFIRDYVEKSKVIIRFFTTNEQLSDTFTKPLNEEIFFIFSRHAWNVKSLK